MQGEDKTRKMTFFFIANVVTIPIGGVARYALKDERVLA